MQLSSHKLTITWIILVMLTLISAGLGRLDMPQNLLISLVLLTVFLKNFAIIDIFMELKSAPLLWRMLMQLFTLFIVVVVGVTLAI